LIGPLVFILIQSRCNYVHNKNFQLETINEQPF
jgi:hypothetical protein